MANLLSNALKFTFKGGITARVQQEANYIFKITVEDTGIGIKDEDKSKLFQAYGKIDMGKDNVMNSQGVGLGLTISNSLVERLSPIGNGMGKYEHRGLWFESEHQRGTKFHFRIADFTDMEPAPVDINTDSSFASIPSEKTGLLDTSVPSIKIPRNIIWQLKKNDTRSTNPPKDMTSLCICPDILVVDDNSFNIAALENVLSGHNYAVLSCYNGQQALDEVMHRISCKCSPTCQPFRLIFMDCNMPVMNGYECAQELSKIFQQHPKAKCPIIACTANALASEISETKEAGMVDYCVKPITKQTIKVIVNKYLS
jgi:CheY-like chemotaxis protein